MTDAMTALEAVVTVQHQVQHVHPIFAARYPVVVFQHDRLEWFQPTATGFAFERHTPAPDWLSGPVQAALPLEAETVCLMDAASLHHPEGAITVLHEFVHCHQARTCEQHLKNQLELARTAMAEQNFMWELEHPFPYANPDFERLYAQQLHGPGSIRETRVALRRTLARMDFEYMLWQEWKEGLARHLENRVRQVLGLPLATNGMLAPFSRVSFYAGGDALISVIVSEQPEFLVDFEQLFVAMRDAS